MRTTEAANETFMSRSPSRQGRDQGHMPTSQEHEKANRELAKLVEQGATKTMLVEYLLEEGWSTSAICDKIRYESDTERHKKGDRLLPQHVYHIRMRWQANKTRADMGEQPTARDRVRATEPA